MLSSSIPTKIPVAWASSAGGGFIRPIPATSQIGINGGYASWPDGFVPLNDTPTASGGIPPFIQDFNGVFNSLSAWAQWGQAGAAVPWDSAFSTTIGGYPKGSIVSSATTFGLYWLCLADANTTNPDTGGANWKGFYPAGGGAGDFYADTGAVNAMVITPAPPFLSYFNGMRFLVNPAFANTGATTINVNGLGAVPVVNPSGNTLTSAEITPGSLMLLSYLNGNFQYLNAPTGSSAASASDIWAGQDISRFVTSWAMRMAMVPQNIAYSPTVTWNLNLGFNAAVTLAGNLAVAVPQNLQQGATMAFATIQDNAGNRTVSWNSCFDFGSVGTPTLSTGANKVDLTWMYVYDAVTPIIKCMFFKSA